MAVKSELISRDAAAEFLGVRPQTLASWASSRRYALPFVKIGRRVMYRLCDLQAFIDANIVMPEGV